MQGEGISARVSYDKVDSINPTAIDALISKRAAEISGPNGTVFSGDAGLGFGGVGMTDETYHEFAVAAINSMRNQYPKIPGYDDALDALKEQVDSQPK